MADTRFQVTFGKSDADQKIYKFLKSQTNGSALVRLLVQNYMINTGCWSDEINNVSQIIEDKLSEQQVPKETNNKETNNKENRNQKPKGKGTGKENESQKPKAKNRFGSVGISAYYSSDED